MPAAGAQIAVLGTAQRTTATAEGVFVLEPIESPTGTLVLSFDADHDQVTDLSRSLDFADWHIGPNHEAALGQVSLRSTATLTGSVLLEGRASGSLAGTDVFVPGLPLSTTTTDTGAFTLAGVPEGAVSVAAASPGFVTKHLDGLQARSGELLVLAPLTLSTAPVAFTQVQGRIELAPEGDLSSVTVVALGPLGSTSLTVDASGQVHGQVQAGHYTFLARATHYSDAVIPNLVAAPDTTLDLGTLRLELGSFAFDAGQASGTTSALCGKAPSIPANPATMATGSTAMAAPRPAPSRFRQAEAFRASTHNPCT